ncbi:MAG: hypothetical protein U0325_21920 [Polyangiales bacterium]
MRDASLSWRPSASRCSRLPGARAGDELGDVMLARDTLSNGDYALAASMLRRLIDLAPTHAQLTAVLPTLRKMYAAALFAQRNSNAQNLQQCRAQLTTLLREDPTALLDGSLYEDGLRRLFDEVREELRDELARITTQRVVDRRRAEEERIARRALAMQLLTSETVVQRSAPRMLTLLPFGLGQFVNGNPTAGWARLATEGTLALASLGTASAYAILQAERDGLVVQGSARGNAIEATYWTATITGGALLVSALIGGLQAFAAWRPERVVTRTRTLPEGLQGVQISVAPWASDHATGAVLGGRF